MSSIRQKWSPITQNTYDDKKYRQHIAIITYLLPLGCSCVGCREGCLHGMCTSSTQFLHMHYRLESNMKKHFWNAFEFDIALPPLVPNIFDCEATRSYKWLGLCMHALIPCIARILVPEKTALRKIWVSVTVLMFQLTRNSITCAYIGQNLHMWKPC